MKIWFRTGRERGGAERGGCQGGEQSRPAGLLRPSVVSTAGPCVQPPAGRKPFVLRHESAPIPSPSATSYTSPAATFRPKAREFRSRMAHRDAQVSVISIRHRPKYRSDRKQMIKPCLTGARIAYCDARANLAANALSNRELRLLEPSLTPCKETIAPRSNRELSTNRGRDMSRAVIPTVTFLTGSGSQTEFAITHSKHTTGTFLTGSRIVNSAGIHPERSSRRAQYGPGIDTLCRLAQDGAQLK
jgi:hypothetical protein